MLKNRCRILAHGLREVKRKKISPSEKLAQGKGERSSVGNFFNAAEFKLVAQVILFCFYV